VVLNGELLIPKEEIRFEDTYYLCLNDNNPAKQYEIYMITDKRDACIRFKLYKIEHMMAQGTIVHTYLTKDLNRGVGNRGPFVPTNDMINKVILVYDKHDYSRFIKILNIEQNGKAILVEIFLSRGGEFHKFFLWDIKSLTERTRNHPYRLNIKKIGRDPSGIVNEFLGADDGTAPLMVHPHDEKVDYNWIQPPPFGWEGSNGGVDGGGGKRKKKTKTKQNKNFKNKKKTRKLKIKKQEIKKNKNKK
jgi:hypothetical protein